MDRKLNYFSPMNIYLSIICLYLIVSLPLSYRHFFLVLSFCRSQTAMSFTNSDIFLLQHREIGDGNEAIEKITKKKLFLNLCPFIVKITTKAAEILFVVCISCHYKTLLSIRFTDKWDRRWNKKNSFFVIHDLRSSAAYGIWESWYPHKCEFMAFVGVANSELIQNLLSMFTSMLTYARKCNYFICTY